MYSQEENVKFQKFLQKVINNPRPIDDQGHKCENGKLWCEDWHIIEILKYLINGKDMYMSDPPPNRLKNNPLWNKNAIINDIDIIQKDHNCDQIIERFKKMRGEQYA